LKKILIICYSFPPYPGIGGRRWAKFAKYLVRRGYDVSVIASENPYEGKVSEWNKDVQGIALTQLPLNFPKALITFPGGILGKIKYRLALMKVKNGSKGNYYDRALFWKKTLLKAASELIDAKGIKNVIVSGAPFHLVHHAAQLKRLYPDLHFIADFRDLWVTDESLSALSSMDEARRHAEKQMEREACKTADLITCVSEEMAIYFDKVAEAKKSKVLPNGFDTDDFEGLGEKKKSEKIRFVFTGNLYNNLDAVFKPFCEALQKMKTEDPEAYNKLRFDFYGTSSTDQKEMVASKQLDNIAFHPPIPLRKTLEEINNADYCLLFLNEVYAFSLSTKFCEYLALKKSIALFSKSGKASEFITGNGLGTWIRPEHTYNDLIRLIKKHHEGKTDTVSKEFDYTQFSVGTIVSELEKHLV
jgi:glycosyltransferase involved in cell wall biosynthesis